MASAGQAHALTTYYIGKYQERYNEKPIVNRNKARWSWDSMLYDLTPVEIKELLDFYFKSHSAKAHDLDNFFYNYDKILLSMRQAEVDAEGRKAMMRETEERTRIYLEKRQRIAERVANEK